MERELWPSLYRVIQELAKTVCQKYVHHQPHVILAVYAWAVIHDRPISWACRESNWGPERERPHRLPSAATLSRRLKSVGFGVVMRVLTERLQGGRPPDRVVAIDGKPLPVGGNSKDPDAKFGRGAGCIAKGFKLHAIWGSGPLPDAWDVQSLNCCEKAMALELLTQLPCRPGGWLLADGNYDASKLYDAAAAVGRQLLAPARAGQQPSKGHYQSPHRLVSRELMKRARGRRLYRKRTAIERRFAHLTGFAGGLAPLPAWVRSLSRVRPWVWMKLLINAVRIQRND